MTDLMDLLQSDKSKVRYDAARSLKALGPQARPAIKLLVAALSDTGAPIENPIQYLGPCVQDVASEALVEIGRPAVPSLIEALRHREKIIREYAASTLGEIGPPAKDSFAALTVLLNDNEDWVRYQAVVAIGKVGTDSSKVVPLLEGVFRRPNEDRFVRKAALAALHHADPQGKMAVPLLIEGLQSPDAEIVAGAAQTLGKFHARARSAVRVLNDQLHSKKRRGESYADIVYTMPVRLDIIRALADIGPEAAAAVPTLKLFLAGEELKDAEKDAPRIVLWEGKHEAEIIQVWAAAALVRIVPNQPEAKAGFEFLVRKLHEVSEEPTRAQADAAEALGTIGTDAAIAVLIQALEAEDTSEYGSLRVSVANALGDIGPPAKAAIPALRKALQVKNPWHFGVPREAARALGEMGTPARIAIPDLTRLRDSDGIWLRESVEDALQKLSADGKQVDVTKE